MAEKGVGAHLCMCKVVSFVCVQSQAEPALILAQMVAHKIRILRQINSLESQLP